MRTLCALYAHPFAHILRERGGEHFSFLRIEPRNEPCTGAVCFSACLMGDKAQFLGISLYFAGKWPANDLDMASGAVYLALRRHLLWHNMLAFYAIFVRTM